MLIYYIVFAVILTAIIDIFRPAKYDDEPMLIKLLVPVVAGLFWPVTTLYFVRVFIRGMLR